MYINAGDFREPARDALTPGEKASETGPTQGRSFSPGVRSHFVPHVLFLVCFVFNAVPKLLQNLAPKRKVIDNYQDFLYWDT